MSLSKIEQLFMQINLQDTNACASADITNKIKQRNVNKFLGKNITKDHDKIYYEIEQKIGGTKKRK